MESVWEGQEDYPLDIGSQWIHGIKGNPIPQVASANGISYHLTEYLQMIYNEGGAISSDEVSSLWGELNSGSDGFIPYQAVPGSRSVTSKRGRPIRCKQEWSSEIVQEESLETFHG